MTKFREFRDRTFDSKDDLIIPVSYANLAIDEPTCLICETNAVGNEEHFLFDCNYYSDERMKLENDIGCSFNTMNTDDKFQTVFEHPFRIAMFVKTAITKRKQKLYR